MLLLRTSRQSTSTGEKENKTGNNITALKEFVPPFSERICKYKGVILGGCIASVTLFSGTENGDENNTSLHTVHIKGTRASIDLIKYKKTIRSRCNAIRIHSS